MTDREKRLLISKKMAASLLDNTILPFYHQLKKDPSLAQILNQPETRHQVARRIADFEATLINQPDQALEKLQAFLGYMKALGFEAHQCRPHLEVLLSLFDQWLDQAHLLADDTAACLHQKIRDIRDHLESVVEALDADPALEDDGFVTAEGVEVDEAIHGMHTSGEDREVIDARTFLAQAELDEEFVERIHEHLEELEISLLKAKHLDPALLSQLTFYLQELSIGLDASIEFEDLGFVLAKLVGFLQQLDLDALDEDMKQVLGTLLEQLISDLSKWAYHIFEAQDAQDIHYLDAALFAAIRQIEILFESMGQGSAEQQSESALAEEDEDGFVTF